MESYRVDKSFLPANRINRSLTSKVVRGMMYPPVSPNGSPHALRQGRRTIACNTYF